MTVEQEVGRVLRHMRFDRGWTQEDVAGHARWVGLADWTRMTVGALERGDRKLDLGEVFAVSQVFHVAVTDLVPMGRELDVPAGRPTDLGCVAKAAAALGVSGAEVESLARRLWGRSLSEERDRRLGDLDGVSPRSRQARRGHITRALLAEMRMAR